MKTRSMRLIIVVLGVLLAAPFYAFAEEAEGGPDAIMDEGAAEDTGEYAAEPPLKSEETVSDDEAVSDDADKEKIKLPAQRHIKVVQDRTYTKRMKHLLEPYFGINPSDSLYFSVMEGVRYNFYFMEELGLQLNFAYVQNFSRDLKGIVEDGLKADAASLINAKIQMYFNLDFVFVPLYGKFSLMSSTISNYDIGLYVGAGAMNFKKAEMKDETSSDFKEVSVFKPAIDVGVFAQMYILKWLNLRMDFTYYYSIADFQRWDPTQGGAEGGWVDAGTGARHNYILTFGVGFLLPPGD